MYQDEIIIEVWRNRDSYTATHHYKLSEMVADLQVRQQESRHVLVDRRVQKNASSRGNTAPLDSKQT